MKYSFIILFIFGPTFVMADRMVRYVFNNGEAPSDTMQCNGNDDKLIDAIFNLPKRRKRVLMNKDMENNLTMNHGVERELWPGYCKDNCRGKVTGTCRASGCEGYRRNLQVILSCDEAMASIHEQLDNLIATNAVSDACKLFLGRDKRIAECFDDIIYGEVESFSLMQKNNNDKQVKTYKDMEDGFTICNTDVFNIEAVVNPCVKYIKSVLTGPNGFRRVRSNEDTIPYTLFGNPQTPLPYRVLHVNGTYTFNVLPDNFLHKQKSITFNVEVC